MLLVVVVAAAVVGAVRATMGQTIPCRNGSVAPIFYTRGLAIFDRQLDSEISSDSMKLQTGRLQDSNLSAKKTAQKSRYKLLIYA